VSFRRRRRRKKMTESSHRTEQILKVLKESLDGVNEDTLGYICGVIEEGLDQKDENLVEDTYPFLVAEGLVETDAEGKRMAQSIIRKIRSEPSVKVLHQPLQIAQSSSTESKTQESSKDKPDVTHSKKKRDKKSSSKKTSQSKEETKGEEDEDQARQGHFSTSGNISIVGLNLTRGGETLLDGAYLKLDYGHIYGLVGQNGVGKTTLMGNI
jgi:ABC-type multidrug transport system fused ATPase/permease subunit